MTFHENAESEIRLIPRVELSLLLRNAENLSIYSADEEIENLKEITSRAHYDVQIIPMGGQSNNLGYLIVPSAKELQREITAEAPINVVDFDDTSAQTTKMKMECWRRLESLGLPKKVITVCDKLARVIFNPQHGEIYEPELDMRFLTYALGCIGQDTEAIKGSLVKLLDTIINSKAEATEVLQMHAVSEEIRTIFQETRFQVELYPDTQEVLTSLRGDSEGVTSNVFTLTYGDVVFQYEKVLPLLKSGAVQAVLLTKAAKGPFLEHMFGQNPWKELAIRYHYRETIGQGINIAAFQMPVALTDDDPKQVGSVNELANRLGLPIEARRVISPDQKRADVVTPPGERVIEMHRDEDLMLTTDLLKVQADLYSSALFKFVLRKFQDWLQVLRQLNSIENIRKVDPEKIGTDFLKESTRAVDLLAEAAAYLQKSQSIEGPEASLLAIRMRFIEQVKVQVASL